MMVSMHEHRNASAAKLLAMLFLLFVVSLANAAFADTESGIQKLAPGDRITVIVFGQPELTGDFTLDSAGNILYPLVGPIQVKNLTMLESQRAIADKLADGILNNPSVSVRLAEPRPIYVLGDVKLPGSYPYRYGSLVKTAIAQAGGFGFAEQLPGTALSEFLVADERVRVLYTTFRILSVRQARLEAQLNGADTFSAPALPQTEYNADWGSLVDKETETFQIEKEAVKKRSDLILSQRPQLLTEINAIQGQIDAEKQQIALVQTEIDQYSKLSERGLTKSSSMLELKLSLASRQSNVWRLEAERSRVQNSVMEFDRTVQELETTRKKQILTELQDARQKLREIEATLPAAEEIREIKLRQTGGAVGAGVAREIVITRLHNNEVTTLAARENDSLEPGDIVEIKRLQSNAVATPTAKTATGQKDAVQATTSPQ